MRGLYVLIILRGRETSVPLPHGVVEGSVPLPHGVVEGSAPLL